MFRTVHTYIRYGTGTYRIHSTVVILYKPEPIVLVRSYFRYLLEGTGIHSPNKHFLNLSYYALFYQCSESELRI
jgi:hypothetical protein